VSEALQALRRQLREKFPQAQVAWTEPEEQEKPATPFEPEAFPAGAISEVLPVGGLGGLGLMVARLLGEPEERSALPDFILVDGGECFDPASYTEAACSRLLWVRCRTGLELMKAADLLIRDGNVPFVLLDLCGLPKEELRQLRSSAWWRLRQAAEKNCCRVVVMSPYPQVPCATLRLRLSGSLGLEDFARPRRELTGRLAAVPDLLRHHAQ